MPPIANAAPQSTTENLVSARAYGFERVSIAPGLLNRACSSSGTMAAAGVLEPEDVHPFLHRMGQFGRAGRPGGERFRF